MEELVYARTLLPVLERSAGRTAVVDGTYSADFSRHGGRVFQLVDAITTASGDRTARFAVASLNSHRFFELWHAAFLGAGVLNPLNHRLAAAEIAYVLADSRPSLLFVDTATAPLLDDSLRRLEGPHPSLVVALDDGVELGATTSPVVRYEELLASGRPITPDEPAEDDAVVLMYTGGTTGSPKGVLTSHRAQVLNLYHQNWVMRPDESSVYLHQSPMFHAGAMYGLNGPSSVGGSVTFVAKFDPAALGPMVQRHGVTETQMVPTMVAMALDACATDDDVAALRSLRKLIYGAAPMTRGLLERLRRTLPDLQLFHGYGMTEASSALSYLTDDEQRRRPDLLGSAGRALPGVRLRIEDPDGAVLGPGRTGEVCARAGNLMTGYWGLPEATEEAFRGGWYHTGDAGYLTDDGYLYLLDRVKDMIISGGENVYSAEVENALSTHPGVAQVAVIGLPDERWGERVHAIVVPAPGAEPTVAELERHARESIAGYKIPRSWELRSEPLPVSGAMKVLKRQLRDELVAEGGVRGGWPPADGGRRR